MDSDDGPHLCSPLQQNKTRMIIFLPKRLNCRLRTASFDECARKDGWYDQCLKQCYTYCEEGDYSTE